MGNTAIHAWRAKAAIANATRMATTHFLHGFPLQCCVIKTIRFTLILTVFVLAQLLGKAHAPLRLRPSLLRSVIISSCASFALQNALHYDGTSFVFASTDLSYCALVLTPGATEPSELEVSNGQPS